MLINFVSFSSVGFAPIGWFLFLDALSGLWKYTIACMFSVGTTGISMAQSCMIMYTHYTVSFIVFGSDTRHPERKVGHVFLSSGQREYAPGRTFRERHSPDYVNSDKMVNTNDQLDTIDFRSEDFNAGYRKLVKHRHKKSYGRKREWG